MLSKLSDFRVTLLGKDIQPSLHVKDLGVTFDQNLSFDGHTIKNVSSCMSILGQINRVKHAFDRNTPGIFARENASSPFMMTCGILQKMLRTHI